MLYDPKWEKQTLPTLASFTAFLESMPEDEKYNVNDPERCALGVWRRSQGQQVFLGICDACKAGGFDAYAIVVPVPHTFGAALERAREAARV